MCKKSLSRLLLRSFWCRALPIILLMLIPMGLLSQNSEPPLSSSDESLRTWETLSKQGLIIYETQKYNLEILRTELSNLKSGYTGLTRLYGLLSQSNEDLNRYNGQIGERMQERDQDLAAAYNELDRQGGTILRLIIAVIAMAIPYIVIVAVWAAKKSWGR